MERNVGAGVRGGEGQAELFKRKTFDLGGSVAVRIPKEVADALSIGAGTSVDFTVRDWKMIISKV